MKLDTEEIVLRAFIIGKKSYIWHSMKDNSRFKWAIDTPLSNANDIKTRGIVFN